MFRGFKKTDPLLPVKVPKELERYHVVWGHAHGVIGVCISVDVVNRTVRLRSPKTKVEWRNPVKWSDLRHTRKMQLKIEKEAKK